MAIDYKYLTLVLFTFLISGNVHLYSGDIEISKKLSQQIPSDIWLINEQGEKINLLNNINIPTIISFVYFDCPGICEPFLHETGEFIDNCDLQPGIDYQIFTISIDPKDKPMLAREKKAVLLEKMKKQEAASEYWKFFTGDSTNIAHASNGVGYGFKQVGDEFIHKACMIILNAEGEIIRYNHGTRLLPAELELTIAEAEKGNVLPDIYKKDEYCFPDVAPAYARLNGITVLIGSLMAAGAILFFLFLVLKPNISRE